MTGKLRTVKTSNLVRDGRRVDLDVTIKDEWEDATKEHHIHTNNEGQGLWIDGKQVTGTCQFSAPKSDSGIRSAIRRWFRL